MPALSAALLFAANVAARPGPGSAPGAAVSTVALGDRAPPYAAARRVGAWVYVAGQIARDPATGELRHAGDVRAQTRLVLDNLRAALATQGATLAEVVKVTVILHAAADLSLMNDIYRQYFDHAPLPVRTTIAGADFGAAPILIEIDAVAFAEARAPAQAVVGGESAGGAPSSWRSAGFRPSAVEHPLAAEARHHAWGPSLVARSEWPRKPGCAWRDRRC
ncbi:MAG TPA: RidA family protein [Rhodanobacter sp.]|nr:RidA family protein [Rhodanobacter sp.]